MGEVKQEISPKSKSQLSQQDGLQETELLAQQSIPSTLGNQMISRIGNTPSLKAHADMLNRGPASNKQLLLQLQRQYGNSYVQQVVQQARLTPAASTQQPRLQAKLTIGKPGDKYEQEADKVAQHVVQQINAPALPSGQSQAVQRQMPEEKEEEQAQMKAEADSLQRQMPQVMKEDELQMKPMVQRQADAGMAATPDLETSINQARGGGQPLANNIRQPMEQAFGADFSGVKVHTNTQADQLNQSIQAKAFTTGLDVFFRSGEYNPGSQEGQGLIAHELTHVVQQNSVNTIHKMESQALEKRQREDQEPETPKTNKRVKQVIGNDKEVKLIEPETIGKIAKEHLAEVNKLTKGIVVSPTGLMLRAISSGGAFTSKFDEKGEISSDLNSQNIESLKNNTELFYNFTKELQKKTREMNTNIENKYLKLYRTVNSHKVKELEPEGEHVQLIPFSTTFSWEFAKQWVGNDSVIFEIMTPINYGMVLLSYPPGFENTTEDSTAQNQEQSEVELVPSKLKIVRAEKRECIDVFIVEPEPIKFEEIASKLNEITQNLNNRIKPKHLDIEESELGNHFSKDIAERIKNDKKLSNKYKDKNNKEWILEIADSHFGYTFIETQDRQNQ